MPISTVVVTRSNFSSLVRLGLHVAMDPLLKKVRLVRQTTTGKYVEKPTDYFEVAYGWDETPKDVVPAEFNPTDDDYHVVKVPSYHSYAYHGLFKPSLDELFYSFPFPSLVDQLSHVYAHTTILRPNFVHNTGLALATEEATNEVRYVKYPHSEMHAGLTTFWIPKKDIPTLPKLVAVNLLANRGDAVSNTLSDFDMADIPVRLLKDGEANEPTSTDTVRFLHMEHYLLPSTLDVDDNRMIKGRSMICLRHHRHAEVKEFQVQVRGVLTYGTVDNPVQLYYCHIYAVVHTDPELKTAPIG